MQETPAPAKEAPAPQRMTAPVGWQKYIEDAQGNGPLSAALKRASQKPNRHERRNLDRLAKKYGMKGMAALYYWRQENS